MAKISVKKTSAILTLLAIFGAIGFYFFSKKTADPQYIFETAAKKDLLQTVSETGTVKPLQEVLLNFLNTGTIAKINVKVGDNVKEQDVLAELDRSGLNIQKNQAQAQLDIARANLKKILDGPTDSEIYLKKTAVEQARSVYASSIIDLEKIKNIQNEIVAQTEKNLTDLQSDSSDNITTYEQAVISAQTNLSNVKKTYQKSIDDKIAGSLTAAESQNISVKTALDAIKKLLDDENAKNNLSVKDRHFLDNTKSFYASSVIYVSDADASLILSKSDETKINTDNTLDKTAKALNQTFLALSNCFSSLENSIVSTDFPQTSLDAYKTTINAQVTLISSGITSLQSTKQALDSAFLSYDINVNSAQDSLAQVRNNLYNAIKNADNSLANARNNCDQQISSAQGRVDSALRQFEVNQADFARLTAPARNEDISLYQAQLKQAQAQLDAVENNLKNALIIAPISGTISKVNYETGEQFSSAKPMISMLAEKNFNVEVDISEADISKIKIGNDVRITLDALGEDNKFTGKVSFIEPAQTIIQDVIYYKIKIIFNPNQNLSAVKPGMTTNTEIITAEKNNVLAIPLRSIINKNGEGKFVRIFLNGSIKEEKISFGLLSDDGQIEVLSGLSAGDIIIISKIQQ
jgi:RND family efflux transporter MFP subunit